MCLCEKCKEKEKHNGYRNFETWSIALILDNDEGMYKDIRAMIENIKKNIDKDDRVKDGIWTQDEGIKFCLSDAIKEYVESDITDEEEDMRYTFVETLVHCAMSRIDWDEIAESELAD